MNSYQKSASAGTDALGLYGLSSTSGILGGLYFGPSAPMGSLRLWQSIKIDEFLELLNRTEPIPKTALLPQFLLPLLEAAPQLKVLPYVPPKTHSQILRLWVDDWLDSGREGDADYPEQRTFVKARLAAVEAYEYSTRGNLRLISDGGSLVPFLETAEEPDQFEFLAAMKRESFARQQLVFMLLSDLRFKLAKCRNEGCGRYFVLKHWKRAYKGGTRCESCGRSRSLLSAKSVTARERKSVKESLYQLAAKRFAKRIVANAMWHRDAALKSSIAKFLSGKIECSESMKALYPKGIQGKWVANAKNWKPIESAATGEK